MSGKEFRLIKELKYSRLTAICAFESRFLPTSCADHYLICCYFLYGGFFIPTCPEEISVLNVFIIFRFLVLNTVEVSDQPFRVIFKRVIHFTRNDSKDENAFKGFVLLPAAL